MHAPLTLPPTVQRDEKNRRALRPFSVAVVAAVLLMQAPYAYAQHGSAPVGPSEKEKAKAQEKRAFEKDTDEAYKATPILGAVCARLLKNSRRDVRYWHKADMASASQNVRF
jgi:hypothetical protein